MKIAISCITRRKILVCLFGSALLSFVGANEAAAQSTGFSGNAFGTYVTVSPGVTSVTPGTTSFVAICSLTPGYLQTDSLPSVRISNALTVNTIATGITSVSSNGRTSTIAATSVGQINFLHGMITGNNLVTISTSTLSGSGFSTSAAGTQSGSIVINGKTYTSPIAPNTHVLLSGLGIVTLNQQTEVINATSASLYVAMLNVSITETNSAGLPVGTSLIIGGANTSVLQATAFLQGGAYGAAISAAPLMAGPLPSVSMPCGGTNGQVQSNNLTSTTTPNILTTGVLSVAQQGGVTSTQAFGETTATVSSVNLLKGMITATAMKALASFTANGTSNSVSSSGSTFSNLVIAGHPEIPTNPPQNTQVVLANLGTLYLNRVIESGTSLEVRMIELDVTSANDFGLAVGSAIVIGDASITGVVPTGN